MGKELGENAESLSILQTAPLEEKGRYGVIFEGDRWEVVQENFPRCPCLTHLNSDGKTNKANDPVVPDCLLTQCIFI